MTAPVKQLVLDTVEAERLPDWAHPDKYTADDNWRTGFEYGGGQ